MERHSRSQRPPTIAHYGCPSKRSLADRRRIDDRPVQRETLGMRELIERVRHEFDDLQIRPVTVRADKEGAEPLRSALIIFVHGRLDEWSAGLFISFAIS